jgi:hypothetical protein
VTFRKTDLTSFSEKLNSPTDVSACKDSLTFPVRLICARKIRRLFQPAG